MPQMTKAEFTDAELTAFLDGEASQELSVKITQALDQDAALAHRIDALDIDKSVLQGAMLEVLTAAPEAPQFTSAQNINASSPRWQAIAALVCACLAIGYFFGQYLNISQSDRDWTDYVAAYHALYVGDTLNHVANSEADKRAEFERVGLGFKSPFSFETLNSIHGLDYKRAQILGYESKAIIQYTFLTKDGVPIALCIFDDTGSSNSAITAMKENMASVRWTQGNKQILLIGGDNLEFLSSISTRIGA